VAGFCEHGCHKMAGKSHKLMILEEEIRSKHSAEFPCKSSVACGEIKWNTGTRLTIPVAARHIISILAGVKVNQSVSAGLIPGGYKWNKMGLSEWAHRRGFPS
jgi:hypothetical protein